mmetsp:Transcript_16755/g.19300  ORF Transcript_16755/g.19300 Transcript_16755/m.19300 type:complete len:145 (+) Transcript_16755:183-617(+)
MNTFLYAPFCVFNYRFFISFVIESHMFISARYCRRSLRSALPDLQKTSVPMVLITQKNTATPLSEPYLVTNGKLSRPYTRLKKFFNDIGRHKDPYYDCKNERPIRTLRVPIGIAAAGQPLQTEATTPTPTLASSVTDFFRGCFV